MHVAEIAYHKPLTGHDEFDSLIADFSDESDPEKAEEVRQRIWDKFGTKGAVFISDMASFSSTSRKVGVCHFLKMIHRTRQIVAPVIEANRGVLLKCDADNCYAFFKSADDAIRASFDVNGALYEANDSFDIGEQVNPASKLGEDLATRDEILVTHRAIENSNFEIPKLAERMVARISEIEIQYVRLPMTENSPGR